jgi:hypothetical protein
MGSTEQSLSLHPGSVREPMSHQVKALDYALPIDLIALFMEMRLGKCLVATRWAQDAKPGRTLILAPFGAIPDWIRELEMEGVRVNLLRGSATQRASDAAKPGWYITNFEGLVVRDKHAKTVKQLNVPLARLSWDVVIADESTIIRNPKAKVTKACLSRFSHVPRKAILSGYPAPEGPIDYFCQMAFLYGSWMGCKNWWEFQRTYFRQLFAHEWVPYPGSVAAIKKQVHHDAFVMTRKQAGVGSRKLYERRYVRMNSAQRRLHRQIDAEFEATLRSGDVLETKYTIVKVGWLARLAGGFDPECSPISDAKANEIVNLLTGELKDTQVVIWFRYNRELARVFHFLKKASIRTTWIQGNTPLETRLKRQRRFNGGAYQAFLMQTKCGKRGIDLSAADASIYYSNYYDGEDRVQSEDRIIHPKKDRPLLYIDLVTENSIDEDVVDMLRDKKAVGKFFMSKLLQRRYRNGQLHLRTP